MPEKWNLENGQRIGVGKNLVVWVKTSSKICRPQPKKISAASLKSNKNKMKKIAAQTNKLCVILYSLKTYLGKADNGGAS